MLNKSYSKKCKKCNSVEIKKDWFKRWRQRYKCKLCGHVFQNKTRRKTVTTNKIWNEYCFWKQTYKQLSDTYKLSLKTIQKKLDQYSFIPKKISPKEVILLIDTTYFSDFGLMVFKDYQNKKMLHYKLVDNENNTDYKNWVKELQDKWWIIKAIVCDWRRWLLTGFWDIPTQMCNFHQVAIIRRYITKKPVLQANKDLKELTSWLVRTDKETFEYTLKCYGEYYKEFLQERWIDKQWKNYFIHRKTRSAYFSLKNNLKYLFTYYDYMWVIDIPNTTNGLEWLFWHVKPKVSLHRGLKKERKIKLILSLLHGQF